MSSPDTNPFGVWKPPPRTLGESQPRRGRPQLGGGTGTPATPPTRRKRPRRQGTYRIRELEGRRDAPALLAMLDGERVGNSPKLRQRIVAALLRVRDPIALDRLIRLAREDSDRGVRRFSIWAVAQLGHRASVPFLLEALQSDDAVMRYHAVRGLAQTRALEAVHPLMTALSDPSTVVRRSGAQALGNIGDPAALAQLRSALHHAWRPSVRRSLRRAIRSLE